MPSKLIILLELFVLLAINGVNANIQCLQCSSETDENCAEGKVFPRECPSDQDSCYTRLVGGHVVRGCIQDILDCSRDPSCSFCLQDECNSVYWPRCYKCGSGEAGCADEQFGTPELCEQQSGGFNFCYTRLENGLVTRGCGFEYPYCVIYPQICQSCFIDGCNGLSQEALQPTKCQQCIDRTNNCIEGNSSDLSSDCEMLADSCFTEVFGITSDALVARACSQLYGSSIRDCASNPLCSVCQGDNCNDNRRLKCHQCKESSLDSSCKDQQGFGAMFCATYRENDQCFTRVLNGLFERGCVSDLEPNDKVCDESGAENCNLCDGLGCNGQKSSSAVATFGCSTIALLLFLAVFFRF